MGVQERGSQYSFGLHGGGNGLRRMDVIRIGTTHRTVGESGK